MANILNSTKAAELVEASTGRPCSRQNLEKLCDRGALVDSPCIVQKKPWRLDGDLVVAEYLAKVSPHQAEAEQPRAKRERPAAVAAPPAGRAAARDEEDPEEPPKYNEERALHEREKRLLAQLERREKEGELIYKADFEIARNAVASQIMNRAEVLPRQIKQVIPHLLTEEMEKIERLIKEMLEGVANWSYEEVEKE